MGFFSLKSQLSFYTLPNNILHFFLTKNSKLHSILYHINQFLLRFPSQNPLPNTPYWIDVLTGFLWQVAERALFLWNNDHIRNLITQNRNVILPIVLPALETNTRSHWNPAVQSLTLNVRKIFSDADQPLFDECLVKFQENEVKERESQEKRESTWKRLEDLAASKAVGNEAVLISRQNSSATIATSPKPRATAGS